MWPSSAARNINYGLSPEMGMFVVAPASSFHHHDSVISADAAVGSTTAATTLGVGVGVGVFPLLAAAPCLNVAGDEGDPNSLSGRGRGGIQLWQDHSDNSQHLKKPTILNHGNISFHSGGGSGEISGGAAVSTTSLVTCHDCGNQSKKDCSFRRCRTCCKSRGFDCATHVKSTWVPASRRRDRQLMNPAPAAGGGGAGSSTSTSGVKKPRLVPSQTTTTNSHTSTSNTTPPRSFETSSSRQDASFRETLPGQIRAPAVFKCVRVTAVDDGEDEYAYQAAVKIGGHVFKGFLYDQGVVSRQGFPNMSELHLGSGERHGGSSSSQLLDPSDVYNAAATGGGLLGGSNYGNPMN